MVKICTDIFTFFFKFNLYVTHEPTIIFFKEVNWNYQFFKIKMTQYKQFKFDKS